jgi:hypothetical protein
MFAKATIAAFTLPALLKTRAIRYLSFNTCARIMNAMRFVSAHIF